MSIRLGLIGAGGIAQTYAQIARTLTNASVEVVVDISQEAAHRLAVLTDSRTEADYEQVTDVDAVIICTPPNTHADIATHFLRQGVSVLCEKPLALTQREAEEMIAAADDAGALLTMASKFRYVDDITHTRGLIESGVLGDIILYENTFASRVDMSQRWNSRPEVSGGGVLIDNGTHSIDIARYLLGPIAEVMAVEGKRVQSDAVEDTARIFIRSEDDVMGSIDLSWTIHKQLDSYVDVYGSLGTVRVGWRTSAYRLAGGDWVEFGQGYDKHLAIGAQVQNFVDALSGVETLVITAQDAMASVMVMEAAYRSLGRNDWISVGPAVTAEPRSINA